MLHSVASLSDLRRKVFYNDDMSIISTLSEGIVIVNIFDSCQMINMSSEVVTNNLMEL